MVYSSITSWQIEGEKVEAVTELHLVSKINAGVDCSHEVRRRLTASWQENYNKPRQCAKKQRHHFAKVCIVKAMAFPVVMYGCES